MKKTFFTFLSIFFFLFQISSSAQTKGALWLGIKGGLSVPNLQAGETENDWNRDYTSRKATYFALAADFQLSPYFSFQPELAYSGEGGQRSGIQPMSIPEQYLADFQRTFNNDMDYLYANLENVSKMNYILLPLMIKFEYPLAFNGRLSVFAEAGPNVGYLLDSKQEVRSEQLRVFLDSDGNVEIPSQLVHEFFGKSIDTVIDAHHELHRWNAGVQGGIGLTFKAGRGKILLQGGGNYGFIPVQKGDDHGKNNIGAANLLLGYMRNIHQ